MTDWWKTGVIYQIYPRSFADSNGDGVGDLAGVIEHVGHLADTLGVDALWLSPFYPSPMKDFGYDVADYCNVDPLFGDLPTFDRLLGEAHARGLRVIIDWVPNHTSDRHPWFLQSRSSREDPRRDWYVWRDANPDGSPPNNWLAAFGGPAWEWDESTGQYYLHSFLPEQPDLNWRNPAVEQAMFDTVRFWMDRGVDGLRIDVAHHIMKDPELRDNPPAPRIDDRPFKSLGEYDSQLHVNDKGHPDVHGVFRRLRRLLDSYDGERFAVGEIHIFDFEEWASYYGARSDELHMPYNFSLLWQPWNALRFRRLVDRLEAVLPSGAWPNYVLGNHDEPRLASRFGAAEARVAAMLLLTLRGTPTLYYGDELGLPDTPIPRHLQQDPWALRVEGVPSRDGCRTPMPWDGTRNAGFSPPDTPTLWLPISEDHRARSVQSQLEDPGSILNLYRRLLAYRRSSPVLQRGSYQSLASDEDCFCYLRSYGGRSVVTALNFSREARPAGLPISGVGRVVFSTFLDRDGLVTVDGLDLQPLEGLLVELE